MVFCGYAWDGLDSEWSCGKLPRMERMACPFTNHNPTCKNQSVVSWPFVYQEKKLQTQFFYGWPLYITLPEGSWHLVLLTYLRALLNFSYVILSFFFLCPHIFARASDLTTRKIPCSLSSHSRMPQFSSGDRSKSRTNSHRWELWRPFEKEKKKKLLNFVF